MGRSSNMSPLGLFQWDSTLFDLMVIPAELDRDVLINNLLAETAELEVLYPNPVVLKNLVGVWSHKQLEVWEKLYATTQYEYNPIENYNKYETGSSSGSGSTTHSGMDTHADRYTTDGEDTTSGDGTLGHWVAGYDSTASGDDDGLVKQTRDESETSTTTEYGKIEDRTGNVAYGHKLTLENEGEHELHGHGNIGVTTTQKLIQEERDLDRFNVYDIIIEDFKMRFCILVY